MAPSDTIVGYTGSMKPTLNGGERIRIEEVSIEKIKPGDVIVYYEEARRYNIVHRVIRVFKAGNGQIGLLCRGDNNSFPDVHIVTKENLVGLVKLQK